MKKIEMREWVASLEGVIDNKLRKWRKIAKVENGETVKLSWTYEQTDIVMEIFWEDEKETVKLSYRSPRNDQLFTWHTLNNKTFNKIMDRVGNLAQISMHPPIDPEDDEDYRKSSIHRTDDMD